MNSKLFTFIEAEMAKAAVTDLQAKVMSRKMCTTVLK
jgi:hypothetical protein